MDDSSLRGNTSDDSLSEPSASPLAPNETLVKGSPNTDDLEERIRSAHTSNDLKLLLCAHRTFERRQK
jgi:hypothetical protein